MRLVTFLISLLACKSALADPVSLVVSAVAYIGTLSAATLITAAAVAVSVATSVYGSIQARKQGRVSSVTPSGAAPQDRFTTLVTSESPHIYVYGQTRVPARVVAILTSGAKDEYQHVVCVFASHECEGFDQVYIAGKELSTLDVNGFPTSGDYTKAETVTRTVVVTGTTGVKSLGFAPVTGTLNCTALTLIEDTGWTFQRQLIQGTDYTFTPGSSSITVLLAQLSNITVTANTSGVTAGVRVRMKLGAPGQTVDSVTNSELGSLWPSTAVLAGHTYGIFRFDLNFPEFQAGVVSIEVVLRGKKIYDPRSATTYWSRNVALVAYDYLRSPICAVDTSDIPVADVIAAANACDVTTVTLVAKYRFNGRVDSDRDPNEILEAMAGAMAGSIDPTTWVIKAGEYTAPILQLLQSDIVGAISVAPAFSDASINNGVKGRYIGSDINFLEGEFKPYQSAVYRTADGFDAYINRNFEFTDSIQRVHNLCRILTEDVRNGFSFTAVYSHKAWHLKVGDRVQVNLEFLGIPPDKVFRVIEKKYGYLAQVKLTLKEDDPSIWDDADAVLVDATPNTNLPNPFFVEPFTGLSAVSGTSTLLLNESGAISARILVDWDVTTTPSVFYGGYIQLQWMRSGDTTWNSVDVAGDATTGWCTNVVDLHWYNIRIRGVNPSQNVFGDWRTIFVQAVGKSALPANVTGFTHTVREDGVLFTWNELKEVDYRRTVLHVEAVWDSTTPPIFSSIGSTFYWKQTTPGTYTVLAKHEDSSGNQSATAASRTVVVANKSTILGTQAKLEWIVKWDAVQTYHPDLVATGITFGVSSSAYVTAYTALSTYLGTLTSPVAWNDVSNYTTINQTTFKQKWDDYYVARSAFEKAIDDKTDLLAANAQAAADAAQTDADAANALLTDIASDNKLTPNEKPRVKLDYDNIIAEQAGITAQATAYSITTQKTAYTAAVTALTTYLGTLTGWNTIPGSTVTIVGTTFRSKFEDVYDARQTLLNKIAEVAGTIADWTNVTSKNIVTSEVAIGAINDIDSALTTGSVSVTATPSWAAVQTLVFAPTVAPSRVAISVGATVTVTGAGGTGPGRCDVYCLLQDSIASTLLTGKVFSIGNVESGTSVSGSQSVTLPTYYLNTVGLTSRTAIFYMYYELSGSFLGATVTATNRLVSVQEVKR